MNDKPFHGRKINAKVKNSQYKNVRATALFYCQILFDRISALSQSSSILLFLSNISHEAAFPTTFPRRTTVSRMTFSKRKRRLKGRTGGRDGQKVSQLVLREHSTARATV